MSDQLRPSLAHHRLKVWHKARRLVRLVHLHPIKDAELRDQAKRASRSVALNIVEGAALRARGSKRRHYEVAMGSAGEVVAAYELACDMGESLPLHRVQGLGSEIAAMLAPLIR